MLIKGLKIIYREKKAFLTFLIVGSMTAAIYFSFFALLWQLLGIHYKTSVSIAYTLAVFFHFYANRRVTFKAHGKNLFWHLSKYAGMIVINYGVTLAIMYMAVELFRLSPYIGIFLAILINVNSNFLLSHFWIFRGRSVA